MSAYGLTIILDNMFDYIDRNPIRFYEGDESRVVVETERHDVSIFKSQYERAIDILGDFLETDPNVELTVPNIVAFCGDRGEGKTSCMLSTAKLAQSIYGEDAFDVLEPIDPSFFDERHNIIELVLGQLYSKFIEKRRYDKHDELLTAFNSVKGCLTVLMDGTDNIYDAIEELDELGNGMTLQKLIRELLTLYLDCVNKEKLVIVIDDMDYNWRRAYEMTQMIAKYLCHPQCIMMMSVSIGQMVEVIETSFKNTQGLVRVPTNLYEVAYKYVEKLIPLQYRVEMPHVYDLCDRGLEIYKRRDDETPIKQYDTIKEGIVNEIFIKTRYLFYNYRDGVSPIVPRNLRMLRQLLGILLKMEVYHKDSGDEIERDRSRQNKLQFQSYFFTNWTRQLNAKNRAFVDTLMRIQDLSQMNKLVVGYMKDFLPESNITMFVDIIKPANYSYNISIGDVFTLLNYIERNPREDNDRLMVFFLKSYYSMLLYHYYDEITVNTNVLHTDKEKGGIYRTESWFKNTNKLQRFVNGAYFQYNHGELLKGKHDGKELDCDQFAVDSYIPTELLNKVKMLILKKDNELTKEDKEIILRAELFILMVSWGSEREIGPDQKKQRDFPQPHHLLSFNQYTKTFMFDILAPFCNLVNPQFAYNRFKALTGNLYQYAYEHEWTLLGQMLSAVVEGDSIQTMTYREMRLASDAIIRNAEVLTSVKEKILSLASTGGDAMNMTVMIANLYDKIRNSEMETYPTAPEESPYTINFRFLKPISKTLRETDASAFYTMLMSLQISRVTNVGTNISTEPLF